MNYFRRTLPSLDALVYFEAAARLQNYTHAAQELHVSQVAVSKRVRTLEDDLGIQLFERRGKYIALTGEGQVFAHRVRNGLFFLKDAITVARSSPRRQRRIIQVAANENVNFFWLAPLVREFQMLGNVAVVSVVTANNVSDVARSETDLAIFHGYAAPEGWVAQACFEEVLAPVVSPECLTRLDGGYPVPLLEYNKESPEWANWGALQSPKAGDDRLLTAATRHCS